MFQHEELKFTINLEKLKEDGFCKVSALSPKEIQSLLDLLSEHENQYRSTAEHFCSTMQVSDSEHRRIINEKINSAIADRIELFLPGYEILFSNFLVKYPGESGFVGVHTDWSYVNEPEYNSYNLWIPLVDVDENNGCLHVWPKSQGFTPTIRPTPYHPFSQEGLQKAFLNGVPLTLTAGQGVLYHSGLIHYSTPNYSEACRPAIGMVLKPLKSQAIHYYRESGNTINKYEVNRDFFLTHHPDMKPSGISPVATFDLQPFSLIESLEGHFNNDSSMVGKYYDDWNDAYQEIYGDVIQAYRPSDNKELLDHISKSAKINGGQSLVDAGCGVCGPAIHFATNYDVHIEAITVSERQVSMGNRKVESLGLKDKIHCYVSDFQTMHGIPSNSKDGVLFLESLGHCSDPSRAIDKTYTVLKKGGFIYIKDFFFRTSAMPATAHRIKKSVEKINRAYAYNVLLLPDLLITLSKMGFVIDFVRAFDFESDTRIRAEFESRFDISVFHEGEFELAEWLEIRAIKYFSENDR